MGNQFARAETQKPQLADNWGFILPNRLIILWSVMIQHWVPQYTLWYINKKTLAVIGIGRLVSINNCWCSGFMLTYQGVCLVVYSITPQLIINPIVGKLWILLTSEMCWWEFMGTRPHFLSWPQWDDGDHGFRDWLAMLGQRILWDNFGFRVLQKVDKNWIL